MFTKDEIIESVKSAINASKKNFGEINYEYLCGWYSSILRCIANASEEEWKKEIG